MGGHRGGDGGGVPSAGGDAAQGERPRQDTRQQRSRQRGQWGRVPPPPRNTARRVRSRRRRNACRRGRLGPWATARHRSDVDWCPPLRYRTNPSSGGAAAT